jgi:ribonucleoside-diphosphate reductase alpha chain
MDSIEKMITVPVVETIAPISGQIWNDKYRLKSPDGEPIDQSIEQTWNRVARCLASVEVLDQEMWVQRFEAVQQDFSFMPAGRIIAGAGTDRRVTLFNCFVMGEIEDDMASIFEHLKQAALTMQAGGGIGYDFSPLRPKGAIVKGVGAKASGAVSFMTVWDSMCDTIESAGARRGAMMATLRVDHPDIEEFVTAKRVKGRLEKFNMSVLITDAFMAAVDQDAAWPLCFNGQIYKTIQARYLWDLIMRETYAHAEPGVIFIDRINEMNNLAYCETISATNPCGEQPLPPYGACLLGSINLVCFIIDPFMPTARLDEEKLRAHVAVAVRMLDNAIDASQFPLEAQRLEAAAKRRIGLGVTGLANVLMMVNQRYGSVEAAAVAENWMAEINRAAYRASAYLAKEKGAFPLFECDAYLAGKSIQRLDDDVKALIAEHGVRNALLTSIAPTGTISLLADNVSSGAEPVFAYSFTRTIREPDNSKRKELVEDFAVRLFHKTFGAEMPLPAHFVTMADLTAAEHIRMQAALQRHTDAAISKTVNLPEDIDFDAFQDVYLEAYRSDCKGCTTYRPNDITGSVLSIEPSKPVTEAPAARPKKTARPSVLDGKTYKFRWRNHAYFLCINDIIDDNGRRPFEIFINSKNTENMALIMTLTRMISAILRTGDDARLVLEELTQIFDPRGGDWIESKYMPSLPAVIGMKFEEHLRSIGLITTEAADDHAAAHVDPLIPAGEMCPACNEMTLTHQGSCTLCTSCGHSTC